MLKSFSTNIVTRIMKVCVGVFLVLYYVSAIANQYVQALTMEELNSAQGLWMMRVQHTSYAILQYVGPIIAAIVIWGFIELLSRKVK